MLSRGHFLRVNLGLGWLARSVLLLVTVTVTVCGVSAHSCHEVKTAFQLRQIGPLRLVPETPGTDAELQICKHQGPTCCTRKMEESYLAAVRRETLQNIRSYSFELKYLIVGHATSFQETFQSLVSFAMNHTLSLFNTAYQPLAQEARGPVSELFGDLILYILGANSSVERAVHRFYDGLFPLVYGRLVNPGSPPPTADRAECLRATRQDVNPFGPHPRALAGELAWALRAGRVMSRALAAGADALNATEWVALSRDCARALVRMQYCPHCRGLTLIRPCGGYCLNVMRGCLAGLAELDVPWRRFVTALEGVTDALAGTHNLELALLGVRNQINDAILYTQLHGPRLTATVDKVCGQVTEVPTWTSTRSTSGATTPVSPTDSSTHSPEPSAKVPLGRLAHLKREFMTYIQRYKTFFASLPEMLCDGEMVVEDFTCWSGEEVVESYSGRVVGNGLQAQKQNPEMKVRSADPILVEVKEKLERFNQEMLGEASLGKIKEEWLEPGSGTQEGSGDCDDEDGCQGSGGDAATDGESTDISRKGVPGGREPGVEAPRRAPTARPPPRVVVTDSGHIAAASLQVLAIVLFLWVPGQLWTLL
ncbi:glypican-5b isoform X2 [Scleropages formosus]|uniref:Glypican 5b n=1 Tax=Scleropages formosus TaxID=113540 RepID=A0A8C9VSY7_SCLFO|nr:glypican-5-like isoform X2 [Scleropages formosus]